MPEEPYDGPGTYDYECDFVEAEMSRGRWSLSVPGWCAVWEKMCRRKYGYEPPTMEDSLLFAEKARAIFKRYQRMKRKEKRAAAQQRNAGDGADAQPQAYTQARA